MAKNGTLNLRVDEDIKDSADRILKQLGIPMSTAIDMFLNQIILTGGIPFEVSLPQAPEHLNMDLLTDEDFANLIHRSHDKAMAGEKSDAASFFASLEEMVAQ